MRKSNIVVLVFAVVLFVSLFRLGSVLLFDVDEAVFAEATKEMVESGDYITATYNGDVRYDKPIFFYWVMALSYKIFGINEFGADSHRLWQDAFLRRGSSFLFAIFATSRKLYTPCCRWC